MNFFLNLALLLPFERYIFFLLFYSSHGEMKNHSKSELGLSEVIN